MWQSCEMCFIHIYLNGSRSHYIETINEPGYLPDTLTEGIIVFASVMGTPGFHVSLESARQLIAHVRDLSLASGGLIVKAYKTCVIRGIANTTVFLKILIMSTNEQTPLSQPTSAVRNTLGKKQDPQGLGRPTSDTALREYCDRNYHPLLPIIAEKVHQEKMQQERLEAVKARLNFEKTSQHSESGTPNKRRDLKESLGSRHACGMSGSPEPRRGSETRGRVRPHTRTIQGVDHTTVAAETLKAATRVLAQEKQSLLSKDIIKRASSRRTKALSESKGSAGGHWKSRPKRQKSSVEDDLSRPWPLRPNAGQCQRGVTCSISLTENTRVWFDDLLKESIDSYDDLKEAFLENCLQQKKCIKDPAEIHNIKQRDGESMEDLMRRYKLECRDVKGAPKCMKIFGFMHGITNSELIKRLHDKISKVSGRNDEGKLLHLIKELKQINGKDQEKAAKKETLEKEKPLAILMGEDETEGPMIIEDEMGGHFVYRMYVDRGSSLEILSPSPYDGIIGRPGVRKIQAVLSTAHGMLKFLVAGETVTLRSSRIIPLESKMVLGLELENVCRFQRLKQIMPERWLSTIRNRLEEEDEEKTAFITSQGIFCYSKMSFGLKNIGATYQRLLDKAFQKQIGQNLEVYVDDLVIKSRTEQKDVQRLNEKLASLNRFLSKSAEKSSPFFKTLKKSDFQWTAEAKMAFKQMKTLIAKIRMLTAPKEKEDLVIYLAAAKEAVSAVLMTKRGGNKFLYTSLVTHTIVVITDQPIKQMLSNSEVAGRLLMWRFELEECDIHYRPRTSFKGQILADFIIERPEVDSPDTPMEDKEELMDPFNATNNEVEYEALIAGLRIAEQMRVKNLQANVDSKLVANQVNETYVAKEPGMIKYLEKVKNLASTFKELSIKQQVLVEELKKKSIDEKEVLAVVEEEGRTWMTPIYEYLTEEILPEEKRKARATPQGKSICRDKRNTLQKPGRKGKQLDERSKNWLEETSHALRAHHTVIKSRNGETPFSLTYGTKAVIPVEIGMPTLRTSKVYMEAKSKAKMEKYYNARVRNTSFKPWKLVYQNNEASHAEDGGKLVPKWEGKYEVTKALGK
nr:hypothetical protein [Tanacetum cinerariifolium]